MRSKKNLVSLFTKPAVAAGVAVALAVAAAPAEAAYVKAGVLTCNVAPSVGLVFERTNMNCTFTPSKGRAENYSGVLRKVGLVAGATGAGVIVWAVLSEVSGVPPHGALAGEYVGATAQAAVVIGAGANVLVGGSNNSFAIQPVSVSGQIGLNFALAVSDLVLSPR